MQVSKGLRKTGKGYLHWCDGCQCHHFIPTEFSNPEHNWVFNGNNELPSFTPSIRLTDGTDSYCCHYVIKDGNVKFENDTSHALKGQTVPLPLLPLHDDNVEDNCK